MSHSNLNLIPTWWKTDANMQIIDDKILSILLVPQSLSLGKWAKPKKYTQRRA